MSTAILPVSSQFALFSGPDITTYPTACEFTVRWGLDRRYLPPGPVSVACVVLVIVQKAGDPDRQFIREICAILRRGQSEKASLHTGRKVVPLDYHGGAETLQNLTLPVWQGIYPHDRALGPGPGTTPPSQSNLSKGSHLCDTPRPL
ncbi:hypothetical protein [Microbaculum marinisediminis]|uniref:Uncharacterized protein n=1 Tax=Microbaculum marinisediminis TaxID=2931392 RepID=A0AAW5QW84_9HYPH|nr:hypothetical protein [Microbaculum sp. A6E488]MCT8970550.1 hypothetical protein [Microbaculum sp. A6E488]